MKKEQEEEIQGKLEEECQLEVERMGNHLEGVPMEVVDENFLVDEPQLEVED